MSAQGLEIYEEDSIEALQYAQKSALCLEQQVSAIINHRITSLNDPLKEKQILITIDPDCEYEKSIQNTIKDAKVTDNQKEDQVELCINKFKKKQALLFNKKPQQWLLNYKYHWWKKNNRPCKLILTSSEKEKSIEGTVAAHIGRCVAYLGRVSRLGNISCALVGTLYQCAVCKKEHWVYRHWYEKVKEVRQCGCYSKNLIEKETSRIIEEWQLINLAPSIKIEDGQKNLFNTAVMPCRVLDKDQFNTLKPGELIKVFGILRTQITDKVKTSVYLDVYNIERAESKQVKCTPTLLKKFKQVSQKKNLLQFLKRQIFKNIIGLDQLKTSIILQHAGGGASTRRREIHLLVIGDPATGKSQIVKATYNLLGGELVTGLNTTTAGLTAAAVKDRDGQWALEAGSIILASEGYLYLDEVNCLPSHTLNALLEPLEQQSITVAKAGFNLSIPLRTSLFAVGNPRLTKKFELDGKFTLLQQIGLPIPFLTRFDLCFIVFSQEDEFSPALILKKLKQVTQTKIPRIIKAYLKYIREHESPLIPFVIKKKIVEYYSQLKKEFSKTLPIITPRTLEGLFRLVEAYGKLHRMKVIDAPVWDFIKNLHQKSLGAFREENQRLSELNTKTAKAVPQAKFLKSNLETQIFELITFHLKEEPKSSLQLFLKIVKKIPELTKDRFDLFVKKFQEQAKIYKPDSYKYKLTDHFNGF